MASVFRKLPKEGDDISSWEKSIAYERNTRENVDLKFIFTCKYEENHPSK